MPDISIQFFATPIELLSFVKEAIREHQLYAVAMRFRPFEARVVGMSELDELLAPSSEFHRWALTVDAPHLPVEHELDHADKNPDHLRLEVGRYTGATLEESWLSCRTGNKAVFSVWKKIAKRLKAVTLPGITATNRQNGVSVEYKAQRYSNGAKALEDRGVTMLPAVGPKGPAIRLGLLLSHPPTVDHDREESVE